MLADVAEREAARRATLFERKLASEEEVEQSRGESQARAASCKAGQADARVAEASIHVARGTLAVRQAEMERSIIKAPFDGRVLKIIAEEGEFAGVEGLLELGRVDRMYAIARVRVGQLARVDSDALDRALQGTVRFIRPKVAKQDEIGTDPAARKDARIVEVGILLEDPGPAAALVNLQVEVVIDV